MRADEHARERSAPGAEMAARTSLLGGISGCLNFRAVLVVNSKRLFDRLTGSVEPDSRNTTFGWQIELADKR